LILGPVSLTCRSCCRASTNCISSDSHPQLT
jgi:hypothetical protein